MCHFLSCMDTNTSFTAAAISAVAAAIDPHHSSQPQSRWKRFWSRFSCFRSQKRDKRIVPASRLGTAPGSAHGWPPNGTSQAGLALAPPSSPASFITSSIQSPANLSLSLSATSANVRSPPPNPMFTIGPYAHETQLVSPPAFSTFNTEPSTAPFTPPPELAHLTTPSSPDVPFAQLLASSLEAKASARETVSPFSGSSLASPADIPTAELQATYQFYPGSPVSHLVSPTSGMCGSGTSSPLPVIEFPAQINMMHSSPMSFFPNFKPFIPLANDQPPCTLLSLSHSFDAEFQEKSALSADISQMHGVECHSDVLCEAEARVGMGRIITCIGTTDNSGIQNSNGTLPEWGEKRVLKQGERDISGFLQKSEHKLDFKVLPVEYRTETDMRSFDSRYCCENMVESGFMRKCEIENVRQIERPVDGVMDLNRSQYTNSDTETAQVLPGPQEVSIGDCNWETKHEPDSNLHSNFQDNFCHTVKLDYPNNPSHFNTSSKANAHKH